MFESKGKLFMGEFETAGLRKFVIMLANWASESKCGFFEKIKTKRFLSVFTNNNWYMALSVKERQYQKSQG